MIGHATVRAGQPIGIKPLVVIQWLRESVLMLIVISQETLSPVPNVSHVSKKLPPFFWDFNPYFTQVIEVAEVLLCQPTHLCIALGNSSVIKLESNDVKIAASEKLVERVVNNDVIWWHQKLVVFILQNK